MGNHCIDVVCIQCGAYYCIRCFDGNGPSELILQTVKDVDKTDIEYMAYPQHCHFCDAVQVYGESIISFIKGQKATYEQAGD